MARYGDNSKNLINPSLSPTYDAAEIDKNDKAAKPNDAKMVIIGRHIEKITMQSASQPKASIPCDTLADPLH